MINIFFSKLLASSCSQRKDSCSGDSNMMSPKRWTLLLIFYISYLMFGASIYYHIEHNLETERRASKLNERNEIHEYLVDQLVDKNATTQKEILEKITDYCGKPVTDFRNDEYEEPYTWTFYHSFFFAFTVCSTVGYGNISPTTTLGRMIMIAYSLIGIPVNGILFAGLGEYFARTFISIYRRYKKYKMSTDIHYVPPQLGLVTTVLIALIPGITIFLLIPSWIFSYFEDWPYSLAFYYAYVTTTTIGFGDYVPTFQPHQPRQFGGWFIAYEIFIIVWFIFSLGYLLMILTFITRGLKSKKLKRLEQQLSANIKTTQNRIWTGVSKDVGYLRRILNELYILKVKPVYAEPVQVIHRSNSCPEFTLYRTEPVNLSPRQRAFSVCANANDIGITGSPLCHASSDTELDKFDKQKTFETAEALRQTTDLLAKVVSALAIVKPGDADNAETINTTIQHSGYHGFSDSQILANEYTIQSNFSPPKSRNRAFSDFNISPKWRVRRPIGSDNEWTWSGDNQRIQKCINTRHNEVNNIQGDSIKQSSLDYVVMLDNRPNERQSVLKKLSMTGGLKRLFPFKNRTSSETLESGLSARSTDHRKYSIVSVPEAQVSHSIKPSTNNTNSEKYTLTQNDKINLAYTSDTSINSRLSKTDVQSNSFVSAVNETIPGVRLDEGRWSIADTKKRKESLYVQNPLLYNRRTSMFPPTAGNISTLTQRKNSFFNSDRRLSTASSFAGSTVNRNLYPNSNADENILETTTLADLIRALEVVHTEAVLDDTSKSLNAKSGFGNIFSNPTINRKAITNLYNTITPNGLIGFKPNQSKTKSSVESSRLYARRSTIVGTLPNSFQNSPSNSRNSSTLLSKRKPSLSYITEPTPSCVNPEPNVNVSGNSTEPALSNEANASASGILGKPKRRFSIRPTALQIPPGQAPPPGSTVRRLSVRISPLARETNSTSPRSSIRDNFDTSPPLSPSQSSSSTARLLPKSNQKQANISSSTHSPLSRIVQISEAQRKSSMTNNSAQDD